LHSPARISGDLSAPAIMIEPGAIINGKCTAFGNGGAPGLPSRRRFPMGRDQNRDSAAEGCDVNPVRSQPSRHSTHQRPALPTGQSVDSQ
jgi:hypothetical protein